MHRICPLRGRGLGWLPAPFLFAGEVPVLGVCVHVLGEGGGATGLMNADCFTSKKKQI